MACCHVLSQEDFFNTLFTHVLLRSRASQHEQLFYTCQRSFSAVLILGPVSLLVKQSFYLRLLKYCYVYGHCSCFIITKVRLFLTRCFCFQITTNLESQFLSVVDSTLVQAEQLICFLSV